MTVTRLRAVLLIPVVAVSLAGCGLNSVPTAEENVNARFADVQADYQRRSDLIGNLVETVKAAAAQESTVFIGISEARARATQTTLSPADLSDPAKVAADAARMRAEIARHKRPGGPFDIKLGEGGLIDLEFAIHTLQLSNRKGLEPRLGDAIAALSAGGLIPSDIGDAHRLLTRMLVTLRLVAPDSGEPALASRDLVARACGTGSWEELLAAHEDARQRVRELWGAVMKAG